MIHIRLPDGATRALEPTSTTLRRHGSDGTKTMTLDEAVQALVAESQRPGTAG
jgi:hypothetical protein